MQEISILKNGGIGVLPTDTIYGLVGSARNRQIVEKIYKLRKRKPNKPFIILISSFTDLKLFNVSLSAVEKGILEKIWPGKVSVILKCPDEKFSYLHRGTNTLAFRLPHDKNLINILEKTGPLVAPSVNLEGKPPAETIEKAKEYFGEQVEFYVDAGKLSSEPSTLIKIEGRKTIVLREGAVKINTPMDKSAKLQELKEQMDKDMSLPLRNTATQLVFGEGNPDTEIYFLGEAPGYYEDQKGRPFIGQAGKLLNQLIESIGLKREDVYISNVVRFRPPENRDPSPEELAAFANYVDKEIEIINPKIFVTLGRFSMGKFLPDVKISQVHGQIKQVLWHGKEITVVPMYHPAAALRAGEIMKELKKDFLVIPEALK